MPVPTQFTDTRASHAVSNRSDLAQKGGRKGGSSGNLQGQDLLIAVSPWEKCI